MIELKNISFKYEDELVLKDISMKIKEGGFTAIIGANGCGKTTLAKHLNGLLVPASGDVIIDGYNTKKNGFEARKKVGFVFQNFEDQLVCSIAEEDVAFGLENLGIEPGEIKKIIIKTLRKLEIEGLAKKNVNVLSFGQKQLVALAGVLAMEPKYIVFDEPTTMLDARNKKNIMQVMNDLNKKGKVGIVLVTNILEDIEYADEVVLLKEGRIIFNGEKSKLSRKMFERAGLND